MKAWKGILMVALLGSSGIAESAESMGIYVQGAMAKTTFLALKVKEQQVIIRGKPPEKQIYKIGKNVVCVETEKSHTKSYFCSLAVNAVGEAEAAN